jgi:hypothetical protein
MVNIGILAILIRIQEKVDILHCTMMILVFIIKNSLWTLKHFRKNGMRLFRL